MTRGRRILLYCQPLTGAGHFVRTFEIARALSSDHQVHLVDGGRPVPRSEGGGEIRRVALPRIQRASAGVMPLEPEQRLEDVLAERRRLLFEAVAAIRPEIVVIEHFPFSKHELAGEIVPLIEQARRADPQVRIVCSLRDIVRPTRYEPDPDEHARLAIAHLREHFNLVLVHADPRLLGLEDSIGWVDRIPVPIEYTGYVSEKLRGPTRSVPEEHTAAQRDVIVSAGGAGAAPLLAAAIDAWQILVRRGAVAGLRLVVFQPLFGAAVAVPAGVPQIVSQPFSARFLDWMSTAPLSISQAGYNTCVNILETRTRAILVPDPLSSDQPLRAQRLAEHGLAHVLDAQRLTVDSMCEAIGARLDEPSPQHDLDLHGANRTCEMLERC